MILLVTYLNTRNDFDHILDKFVGVLLVVRPLLKLKKQQLIDYCTKNHLEYHEDYTNYDTRYTRNHVRHIDLKKYNEHKIVLLYPNIPLYYVFLIASRSFLNDHLNDALK